MSVLGFKPAAFCIKSMYDVCLDIQLVWVWSGPFRSVKRQRGRVCQNQKLAEALHSVNFRHNFPQRDKALQTSYLP